MTNYEVDERLAQRYCSSCHLLPEPSMLSSEMWEKSIFPTMSSYFKWDKKSSFSYANKAFYNQKGTLPMNDEHWARLLSFYTSNADSSTSESKSNIYQEQSFFETATLDNICNTPLITSMYYDDGNNSLWCGCEWDLHNYNFNSKKIESFENQGVVSAILNVQNNGLYFTDAGRLDPHEAAKGSLKKLNKENKKSEIILDSLQRPVHFSTYENGWIVSEFGNATGGLNLYNPNKKNLVPLPGSYKTYYFDYDKDGKQEFIGLFSQAKEGIFKIDPKSKTRSKFNILIPFPVVFGASDLDTVDINKDGYTDLLVAFGDNADFSNELKNYHGVRIYLNDKKGSFEEAFHFPFFGATQVKAIDFSSDGKMDIAISSYFPDSTENGILFLKNESEGNQIKFNPYGVKEALKGRWLIMEKGDFDQDGDVDLALGSYIEGPTNLSREEIANWRKSSIDILLFLNK